MTISSKFTEFLLERLIIFAVGGAFDESL